MKIKALSNRAFVILLCLALAISLPAQRPFAGDGHLSFGQNFRIHPSNIDQTEVFLVKSPADPDILFAGCNTINFNPFFVSEGIYTSLDGGNTWQGSDTCKGDPIAYHGGDPGIAIDRNGTFILTRLGREPFVGLYSHFSNDNGVTWSNQQVISTDDLERAALISDANPQSAYHGRTYGVYVKFALPYPVMFTYTDDGAKSWIMPKAINNPPNLCMGGDLVMGPNGEVYCCWAGITDVTPFKEIHVGFASSVNGGTTWQVTENAFPVNGIKGVLTNKHNIRVNGLPCLGVDTTHGPRRGWIYIITAQKDLAPAGSDPDIVMYRSTDGGVTWSAGIRVNQDALNNHKTQYFPNVHVDRFGAVNVLFYDDRTTTTDSTGVFLARSLDGGDTWKEYEVSDHHFMPFPIGGLGQGYQGDIIDLTSTETTIWPVWMDNITGVYQVWTVPVKFSDLSSTPPVGAQNLEPLPVGNWPNPFRNYTTIKYHVPAAGRVRLEVFDPLGKMVAILADAYRAQGTYDAVFSNAECENPGGIYLCRLILGDRVETCRMIGLP